MAIINETSQNINKMVAKQGLEEIKQSAEAHLSATRESTKRQQFAKDMILPALIDEDELPGNGKVRAGSKRGAPSLPKPSASGFSEASDQMSLIAIIAKVLILQSKMSSLYWKNLYMQASQNMKAEVEFAPVIGAATKANWDAQARATAAEAEQSKQDGIISLCMFGATVITTGMQEFKSWKDEPDTAAVKYTKESPISEEEEGTELETADEMTNSEKQTFGSNAKKDVGQAKSKLPSLMRRLAEALSKAQGAAMMWGMLGQGITGLVNSQQLVKKEKAQGDAGVADALAKMCEQYAQYYGQAFSRTEDLRQGAQQAIDYAMNILKSAADNLTQAVVGMFRG